MEDLICHIGVRLSYEDETIRTISAGELTPEDLGELSTMLIENPHPVESVSAHLPDDAFIRSQEGHVVPMTKAEVRAVSMAKLGLTREAVFYDIGAGTGSVSIEAALHGEQVQVYAIEQREDACDLIRANRRKFRVAQVQVIHGSAPEAMEGLPVPTHAFIGGSTGHLQDIIRMLKEKNPEVALVINVISLETIEEVMCAVRSGLLRDPEIIQMNVAASRVLGRYHMMTGQNPGIYYYGEETMTKLPGILLAAPSSGSGKTIAACGLMAAFRQMGKISGHAKPGPDYIDPMFIGSSAWDRI